MFREISKSQADQNEINRRWFQDPAMDLFVWTNANNAIYRFQLIYTAFGTERTFEWSLPDIVRNFHSETGNAESAILNREVALDALSLLAQFEDLSEGMDAKVKNFVIAKLKAECQPDFAQDEKLESKPLDLSLLRLLAIIFAAGILFVLLVSALT